MPVPSAQHNNCRFQHMPVPSAETADTSTCLYYNCRCQHMPFPSAQHDNCRSQHMPVLSAEPADVSTCLYHLPKLQMPAHACTITAAASTCLYYNCRCRHMPMPAHACTITAAAILAAAAVTSCPERLRARRRRSGSRINPLLYQIIAATRGESLTADKPRRGESLTNPPRRIANQPAAENR
ncbi:hypothetical protein Bbelb_358010 [Branchiostoma belcheri]|nr:hypothetical protein Bbelb_358010 [Branchiostoma belcheri]